GGAHRTAPPRATARGRRPRTGGPRASGGAGRAVDRGRGWPAVGAAGAGPRARPGALRLADPPDRAGLGRGRRPRGRDGRLPATTGPARRGTGADDRQPWVPIGGLTPTVC